jgi:hypothetical protein
MKLKPGVYIATEKAGWSMYQDAWYLIHVLKVRNTVVHYMYPSSVDDDVFCRSLESFTLCKPVLAPTLIQELF